MLGTWINVGYSKAAFPSFPGNQSRVTMQRSRQQDEHGSGAAISRKWEEKALLLPLFLLPATWNADMRAGAGAAIFLRIAKQQDKKETLCQSTFGAFYT